MRPRQLSLWIRGITSGARPSSSRSDYTGLGAWARLAPNDDLLFEPDLLGRHVVCIGGHVGNAPARILRDVSTVQRVDVVEPLRTYAESLRRRFAGDDRVHVHHFALGSSDRTESMIVAGDHSTLASTDRQMPEFVIPSGTEEVTVRDVAVLSEWGNGPTTLFMNCEGGEYEILPALFGSPVAGQISTLIVQFHKVTAEPLLALLATRQQLAAGGWVPLATFDWAWDVWVRPTAAQSPESCA